MDSSSQVSSPARPRRVSAVSTMQSPAPSVKSPRSPKTQTKTGSVRKRSVLSIDTIASQGPETTPSAVSQNVDPAPPRMAKIPKIKQSKIPATPGRSLHEITEAEGNVRTMGPPSLPVAKRSVVPDKPKRKTLAERAGEVSQQPAAPPVARVKSISMKPPPTSGLRTASVSSTGSSTRVPSVTSRITSSSSMSSANMPVPTTKTTSAVHRKTSSQVVKPVRASHTGAEGMMPPPIIHYSMDGPMLLQKQRRPRESTSNQSMISASTASSMNPFRNMSITSAMQQLSLSGSSTAPSQTANASVSGVICPSTPSYIPKTVPQTPPASSRANSPTRAKEVRPPSTSKKGGFKLPFLSRYTNTTVAWTETDHRERMDTMESLVHQLRSEFENGTLDANRKNEEHNRKNMEQMAAVTRERDKMQDKIHDYISKINELESSKATLAGTNRALQAEIDEGRARMSSTIADLDHMRRMNTHEIDDLNRKYRNELQDMQDDRRRLEERLRSEAQTETDRLIRVHLDELEEADRRKRNELEQERTKHESEMQEVSTKLAAHRQTADLESGNRDRELQNLKTELEKAKLELETDRALIENLKSSLAESSASAISLEASMQAMRAKIGFLESNSQSQSQAYADMDRRMQEALASAEDSAAKLRQEETLRRKLHNQVQELKGNIRVFCRVRPPLGSEVDDAAKLVIPDETEESKELVVTGPEQKSSLGTVTASKNAFSYDRVFGPTSQNLQIFDEISQLVQSALDGYNVCIFCYGQTGSGKTHTMSSDDGMIPLAVHQIYDTATKLEDKGWKYTMEGSFVEVYNENLNDLLGKAEELDKKKLEIRHDNVNSKTTLVGVETITLDTPATLTTLLQRAGANRSVAATKANSRSSRSHSVFILKLTGVNSMTGERSEGTLNLVDLAGSERLGHSQATGDRLKETQSINKSLSCLGDVIAALGQGKDGGHVPYRNSKLTYLLQHSLGGNSKTLMFVMISPLQAHLSETLTSLKFATKVHNTHIGTATRQKRVASS